MAQKAKTMLPNVKNKWLCNVQLSLRGQKWEVTKAYFRAWIAKISSKVFRIGYPFLYLVPN